MSACAWVLGCCLLCQTGDDGAIDVPEPRVVPRRPAAADRFRTPSGDRDAAEGLDRTRGPSDGGADSSDEATGDEADDSFRRRARQRLFPDESSDAPDAASDGAADEAPPARTRSSVPRRSAAGGSERKLPLQPVEPGERKLRPPDIIAEALRDPEEAAVTGRTWRLVDVIGKLRERPRQLAAVEAYWKLAAAEANYYFALDQRKRFADVAEGEVSQPMMRGMRAAARAASQDAEAAVRRAQHALGDLLGVQPGEELPLAIDRPHTGPYNTNFEKIYGGKSAPARMWLIHHTLPDRRDAIDAHAEAVQYALDAWEETAREYDRGTAGATTLIAAWERLARARRAFVVAVRQYNLLIAEYALQLAPVGATAESLAGMLIQSKRARPAASEREADEESPRAMRRTTRGQSAGGRRSTGTSWAHTVAYVPTGGRQDADEIGTLYGGLVDAAGPLRTQKLAETLHWDRVSRPEMGQALTLLKYLDRLPPAKRRDALVAYWKAREQLARYQAADEHLRQLGELRTSALMVRGEPGGAGAMLRLASAQWAARARRLDEQVGLKVAQFEATAAVGRPLAGQWVLPATPPHAGRYRTVKARTRDEARAARKPVDLIDLYHDRLVDLSEAIVLFDQARLEVAPTTDLADGANETGAASPRQSVAGFDAALAATEREARETRRFLRLLTNYNVAIGDYVLAVAPAATPVGRLVSMLVVERAGSR